MRFTTERYERMVAAGVLTDDDRVELIDGEILEMPPLSPEHSSVVQRLTRRFYERLGDEAIIFVQDAIRLPPDSEPEPDIVLVRPPEERYRRRHPDADDVLLIVEVIHSSGERDRLRKLPLDARHGILEVWLIDVPAGRFEVHRNIVGTGYASVEFVERGSAVAPLKFPDVSIAVDDVLF